MIGNQIFTFIKKCIKYQLDTDLLNDTDFNLQSKHDAILSAQESDVCRSMDEKTNALYLLLFHLGWCAVTVDDVPAPHGPSF